MFLHREPIGRLDNAGRMEMVPLQEAPKHIHTVRSVRVIMWHCVFTAQYAVTDVTHPFDCPTAKQHGCNQTCARGQQPKPAALHLPNSIDQSLSKYKQINKMKKKNTKTKVEQITDIFLSFLFILRNKHL